MHQMNRNRPLSDRWGYLQNGAGVAAMLTRLARDKDMDDVARAIHAMDRTRLEAATLAMVLIHAQDPDLANDGE